jgi:hypothetical protein
LLTRGRAAAPVKRLAAAGQIGPGAEGAAGAGDHDHTHLVVLVGAVEGLDQLASHRVGPRVQPLGTVQGDGEDAILELVADLLKLHGGAGPSDRGWKADSRCPGRPRAPRWIRYR